MKRYRHIVAPVLFAIGLALLQFPAIDRNGVHLDTIGIAIGDAAMIAVVAWWAYRHRVA